jgi:hypothetical protein
MHIPHPERLTDEEFEEAIHQYNWIAKQEEANSK